MANAKELTVIIGGNGKTGGRVAQRLRGMGRPVRLASRSTAIPFDWNDESSWQPALADARALYMTYYPDLALPGAAQQVEGVCAVASQCGVEKIVLLAGRGEPQVHRAENAVRSCGIDSTILECAFFADNFTEGVLAPVGGAVTFCAGDIREPFICCDDIADVATLALSEEGHRGKTYELTGPEAISFAEATRLLGLGMGKPLEYVQMSLTEYGHVLAPHMPPPVVDFFLDLFGFLLDGHNAYTTSEVEQLLGRPARSFEQFVQTSVRNSAA